MEIVIRKLHAKDADQISRIYGDITQKPVDINFKSVIEHDVLKGQDSSFVAEFNGAVVGFMISYVQNLGFGIEKSAWIATLGVSPQYMGQGIGEGLARATFQVYQNAGIKSVYTSVRWDSTDLLSFFKTLGFDRSNFINLCKSL
ncbi:MAG: GNAT family N-acetyltransferase [Thermodesulfobacteriota bacterium]